MQNVPVTALIALSEWRATVRKLEACREREELSRRELSRWKAKCKMPIKELAESIGLKLIRAKRDGSAKEQIMDAALERLAESNRQMRRKEFKYRLGMSISETLKNRGIRPAIVFDTLTIAPWHYQKHATTRNQTSFYVRSVQRMYPEKDRKALGYYAVNEYGSKTGREHWHIVWVLPYIPGQCIQSDAIDLRIHKWPEWKFGQSRPLAVRYHRLDWYGVNNWPWPVDEETGLEKEADNAERVIGYVTKYVTKGLHGRKGSGRQRTRCSRGFGLAELRQRLQEKPTKWLEKTLESRAPRMQTLGLQVPKKLLKRMAMQELAGRIADCDKSKLIREYKPAHSIVELLNNTLGAAGKGQQSMSTTSLAMLGLSDMAISELAKDAKQMREIHKLNALTQSWLDTCTKGTLTREELSSTRDTIIKETRRLLDELDAD